MDERQRLESTIEEAGADLREKQRQELLTADPIERKRLRTEIETRQRQLFEFRKQFDAITLPPDRGSGEGDGPPESGKREHPAIDAHDRTKVFISYSQKDRKWFKRLLRHIESLEHAGRIEVWDDARIRPGQRWREEFEEALATARLAVLLVSIDYLASDFVFDEGLPLILEGARRGDILLLPVILGPCGFHRTGLAEFQTMNSPLSPLVSKSRREQEKIFSDVAHVIERYLPNAAAATS